MPGPGKAYFFDFAFDFAFAEEDDFVRIVLDFE